MKILPIVAGLIVLFAPIVFSVSTLGNNETTTILGSFYISTKSNVFGIESSSQETLNSDWFKDNGLYDTYYGSYVLFYYFSLLMAAIAIFIGLRTKGKQSGKPAALVSLLSGLTLLAIRYLMLSDANSSFYEKKEILGIQTSYLEIPVAALFAILLGIFGLIKD